MPALLARAKTAGFDWILPHECLLVGAADYRVWGSGDVDDYASRFAKMRAKVGWSGDEPEILDWMSSIRRMRDRKHSFSSLAPITIFPLVPADVADVVAGLIELIVSLHLPRLERALSRDGSPSELRVPQSLGRFFCKRAEVGVARPARPICVNR